MGVSLDKAGNFRRLGIFPAPFLLLGGSCAKPFRAIVKSSLTPLEYVVTFGRGADFDGDFRNLILVFHSCVLYTHYTLIIGPRKYIL
jgi:hypothetical protein